MKPLSPEGHLPPNGWKQSRSEGSLRPWPGHGRIADVHPRMHTHPMPDEQMPMDERPSPGTVDGRIMIVYTGPSMNPTLVAPLLVEVEAYPDAQAVRPGDVILFHREGESAGVIHRVLHSHAEGSALDRHRRMPGSGSPPVSREGVDSDAQESPASGDGLAFITRGDNNGLDDREPVPFAKIQGNIVAARRGTRTWPVAGGQAGLALHYALRVRRRFLALLARIGRAPWRALAESGFVARLLPRRFAPRVIAFQQGGMQVLQLYVGTKPAGVWNPETGQWQIRRAFRLLVDTRRLPRGEMPTDPENQIRR